MRFDTKTCPICNKPLATVYPKTNTDVKRYLCSTHVSRTKLSHYYIEVAPGNMGMIQVINSWPYHIRNLSNDNKTHVYYLMQVVQVGMNAAKKVIELPRLPVNAKLADRVKLLVLFS
jgi:hypothetical protein